ncbi:MAG: class I SAM-dependent methyltransferase [Phycicoccus sp.]|nr:class I SAM-dependent methyltransferase [Phycicoccus sp.]NMM33475.1 class I SAM-dependent methyltransferase [Phycicoccus sp.]
MTSVNDGIAAYWNDYADAYDAEPDHGLGDPATREAWRLLLERWLPAQPSDVADLACGTGSLTALVAGLGHRVTGVDLAGNMVDRARAKTAQFGERVTIRQGDVSAPPIEPGSVDVILARHILWTLPDPGGALAGWCSLLRPGGRFLLVEGRWWSVGDAGYNDDARMPWAGGVRAVDLAAALEPLVSHIEVVPLADPVLWGKEIVDERYLLVARVEGWLAAP